MTSSGSTSQKHKNFISEPMGEKPVTELAGIGDTYGKRLEGVGFDKAYVVLGQFLVLKKNEELFVEWLKDVTKASGFHAQQCFNCLNDWCESFL
ncbi:unnamed protein product [Allacma fusca]|uniref:Barrier-to-autointegration factor-like protein n=1 Tax=Allacma fusca TaxID=39272 RepID=A0A8J2P0H8_9HEXA|nr:unnamed protein product [Allacma fusca]